ncbi:hypothetical protein OG785_33340 [Streptomyces sp. NBC_00006]|uniref:hypothetical protein n=1 Tax=Streptomyces sp. NBC_00006 TaxID=2975619 RepID=UPI0022588E71|nr:hypothetical protein [Streptomyces sp. NBC_00006]MCX5535424.1 hypothetical protein [Streptomyces sp. NBC_00006]
MINTENHRKHPVHDLSVDVTTGDMTTGFYYAFYNVDTKRKYVTIDFVQHELSRLVVECFLDRELTTGEHVHHLNGQTAQDSIANLEVRDYPEPLPPRGTAPAVTFNSKKPKKLGVWS